MPICFEKSSFMVIAMLGVLKAESGYVPLDPSHRGLRLKNIISQTNLNLVLVSAAQNHCIIDETGVETFVNSHNLKVLTVSESIVTERSVPQNIAYVIFASSNTRNPKGVIMEHGSVSLSMVELVRVFGYCRKKRMRTLQFSSYTFDVSVVKIFATFAFGGEVCVPSDEDRISGLQGVISIMDVNNAFIAPAVAKTIQPKEAPFLEVLCMTGEPLTSSLVQKWTIPSDFKKEKLSNTYCVSMISIFPLYLTRMSDFEKW